MTSEQITNWIYTHYGQENMRPGMDRIETVLKPLLPKFTKTRIITIAGTNGKGETTLRLSQYLAKRKHFVWTSPHVERITERFRSEEGEISLDDLSKLIKECHEELLQTGVSLSFYEFLFYVFCSWASRGGPEFLLLEVGLGGRLDAVNVFAADLVLLTSISRDHQEFLGTRYEQILREKLGVTRPGRTILSYLDLAYLRDRAARYCEERRVSFFDLEALGVFRPYEFSSRNQLLAYAAFYLLEGGKISELPNHLSLSKWVPSQSALANRGEVVRQTNEWHFFGSHNPDGLRKLIQFLCSGTYNFRVPELHLVLASFSLRKESDVRTMMKMLKTMGKNVRITSFPHAKAYPAQRLEELAIQEGLAFVHDPETELRNRVGQKILVLGSYYFLGHIRARFLRCLGS